MTCFDFSDVIPFAHVLGTTRQFESTMVSLMRDVHLNSVSFMDRYVTVIVGSILLYRETVGRVPKYRIVELISVDI